MQVWDRVPPSHSKHAIWDCEFGLAEYYLAMSRQVLRGVVPRKRGNPNWGKPIAASPALATQFEMHVRHLRLPPEMYVHSAELRSWCQQNRNRCYIPEWLLNAWDILVESDLSGAA